MRSLFQTVTWNVNARSNWPSCAKVGLDSSTIHNIDSLVQRPFLMHSSWSTPRTRRILKAIIIPSTSLRSRWSHPLYPPRRRRSWRQPLKRRTRRKRRPGRSRTHAGRPFIPHNSPLLGERRDWSQTLGRKSLPSMWRPGSE